MDLNFMINSESLLKLKDDFGKAVKLIKTCIDEKRPILIRHHCDADGFCGGVVLERAMLPLIYDRHSREREAWFSYSRKPNMAPYYSYDDANKDLSYFLSDKGKYEHKKPLVIVIDNGSSDEDFLALKKLKIYDVSIIVIDHHPITRQSEDIADAFINPHKAESIYDFSAGMLCAEIAKFLNPKVEGAAFIAAVSAYADKVNSRESGDYLSIALKEGYVKESIPDFAEVLDFEADNLGFSDNRQIMDDLLGKKNNKQEQIISMLKEVILKKKNEALISAKRYSHISHMHKLNLVIVPIGTISMRGEYPPPSKIVGMMHEFVSKEEDKPTITIGLTESSITFRGSSSSNLDVNEIIKGAKHRCPYAQVHGGGHKKAGTMRFIPAAYEEIREFVLQKVRE